MSEITIEEMWEMDTTDTEMDFAIQFKLSDGKNDKYVAFKVNKGCTPEKLILELQKGLIETKKEMVTND